MLCTTLCIVAAKHKIINDIKFLISHFSFLQSRNKEQRGRKENVVVVKKVRTRTRPTTTTEVPETTRRSSAVRTRPTYASRNVNRERGQTSYDNNNEDNRVG